MKSKVLKNICSGLLGQMVTICIGFLIPRLMIINLGSEVNGLVSSINQLFVYVALLEAGIGGLTLHALYNPIANDDKEKINSILTSTSKYYLKIGFAYIIMVLILSIVYSVFIPSPLPIFKLVILIILIGLTNGLTYIWDGKYKLYLQAVGKNYINNNINSVINIISSLSKILLLINGFDVVVIHVMYLVFRIITATLLTAYVRINYPFINIKSTPDNECLSKRKSVMIHNISGIIFKNIDVFLLTFLCDLKTVSIYTMYMIFIDLINGLLVNLTNSFVFALGNIYHINKEKFVNVVKSIEVMVIPLVVSTYTITTFFLPYFFDLYTKGADVNYNIPYVAFLFCLYRTLDIGRFIPKNVIDIAGHYKETEKNSIIETTINLICSIVFCCLWGIHGVLLGTIIALLYRTNDMIIYTYKHILSISPKECYFSWGISVFVSFIYYLFITGIPVNYNTYLSIIFFAGVFYLLLLFMQYVIVYFLKKQQMLIFFETLRKK